MTPVWTALEKNTALRATASVWRSLMRNGFETFQSAFLQKSPDLAKGIFCEKCHSIHEVMDQSPQTLAALKAALTPPVFSPSTLASPPPAPHTASDCPSTPDTRHPSPSLIAVCCREDLSCPDIQLTPADIEQWSLNWPKFARALCQAFGLSSQFTDLKLFNTHQIGAWSADAVPVILTIQPDRSRLRSTICELSDRLRRPYILLAPTNANLDATIQETLARANAAFFPLETTIRLTDSGTLLPVKAPGELFAKFTPQPKELDQDVATRAFALVSQFDADVLQVFKLYCLEGLSGSEVARRCKCSKATVMARLKTIRTKTGLQPAQLRRLSPHFSKLEDQVADPRASRIHRPALD